MTNKELYDTIFVRKSVRKYDMTPLTDEIIYGIKEYASKLKPLDGSIRYSLSFLGEKDARFVIPTKLAPHYLCLYSEKKDGYLMNAGFLLQQVDLYMSATGLGSCWLGFFKPKKEQDAKDGLDFIIMLAFGKPAEQLHRKSISEFSRKSFKDITSIEGAEKLLEPVRLAPSATNSQPWFFSGALNEITVSRKKLSMLKASLLGRFNQMDIGIALCHLWLSLDNEGKAAVFEDNNSDVPEGYEFMAKVKVKDK
ncbi:nitroreductase [Ruminiclostridium sufflavum DSM 19573]|uniref:Nitroreductase n=1 Tax=Ruminiclostridium sufflavum DSM 19573 TaxID=1121337 RepID=A0A318XW94_9FIRM|nr:nitroreductase family protein [Ruminiclostridium sufflavum]PYG87067.1 nitroreductase [Ruminiclostridium sufflavum DSM 19573]